MATIDYSQTSKRWAIRHQVRLRYKRSILPIALMALLIAQPTRHIAVSTLSDAFWAVSAYVAFTLALYHYTSRLFDKNHRIIRLYNHSRTYQVVFAALLGAMPGCGGAIIVTTQFVSGRVGFGAIVAVLTSTMGDAAFLLLASEPQTGLGVIVVGIMVGTFLGMLVNAIHCDSFLRPVSGVVASACSSQAQPQQHTGLETSAINLQGKFWQWALIPATLVAFLGSFQIDVNALLSFPDQTMEWVGAFAIVICIMLWAFTNEIHDYESSVSEDKKCVTSHPLQKTAQDTNFVTAWVIGAFLTFELTTAYLNLDLAALFSGWGVWMPLMGVVVGLLPGCGPQILVTSLYISGAVPLSAQLANAISNDGDALFPAIALAPKAALVATFYSAIPAMIVGYGYYWMFE